jgi:hypothetical protein
MDVDIYISAHDAFIEYFSLLHIVMIEIGSS